MKKIITLIAATAVIFSFSLPAFAAEPSSAEQAIERSIAEDTLSDLAVSAAETKDDTVLKSDVKSFKGKFTGLLAELNKLRAECKGLWAQIKEANQSIKTEWNSLKEELKGKDRDEAKKILTDLKAEIEPLRTQAKDLRTGISDLRTEKKSEWTDFRSAVKSKDEAKASAALNSIIDLKKQIISKQKELLPVKQQILEDVKD